MVVSYSTIIEDGALSTVGSTLLLSLLIVGVLGYMCYKRGLDIDSSAMVFLPTVTGIISAEYFPEYVYTLFLIGVGALWGYVILKVFRLV